MDKPLSFEDRHALEEMGRDLNSHVHHWVYEDHGDEEYDWRNPTEGAHRGEGDFDRPELYQRQQNDYFNSPIKSVRQAALAARDIGTSAITVNKFNSDPRLFPELRYLLNNVDSSNVPELHRAIHIPAENFADMERHLRDPESIGKYYEVGQTLNFGARSTSHDPNIAAWWHGREAGVLHSMMNGESKPRDYDERHLPKHLVTFHFPKQTRALQIASLVPSPGQCEYLLSPDQQFRIKHYGGQDDNLVHHFYLEGKQ